MYFIYVMISVKTVLLQVSWYYSWTEAGNIDKNGLSKELEYLLGNWELVGKKLLW